MPTSTLDNAIKAHPFPPKGIKVGPGLWKELIKSQRINWKRCYINGVIDSEIDLPVINGKIFVHVDPELDDFSYHLPPSP